MFLQEGVKYKKGLQDQDTKTTRELIRCPTSLSSPPHVRTCPANHYFQPLTSLSFSLIYLHALRLVILQTGLSQNRFIPKTGLFEFDPPPC